MNNERTLNPGMRVTLWPAVLLSFLLAALAISPMVSTASQPACRSGNGTIPGTIQKNPTGATCISVISNGGYTPGPKDGCTLTLGYWKNHWSSNIPSLTIAPYTWTNAQLLAILQQPSRGDPFIILMYQLITAWLNSNYGAGMSTSMQATYAAAVNCITGQSTACSNATNLANQLDTYNNGNAPGNPDHCPNGPQWTYACQTVRPAGAAACPSGQFYGTHYTFKNGQFVVDNVDYANPYFCMTSQQCPTSQTVDECHSTLPCDPAITWSGVILSCGSTNGINTSNLHASVTTTCPINEVLRAPFPRSMVNVPTNFFLQPEIYDDVNGRSTAPQSPANLAAFTDANGNPTEAGYNAGIWRNLVLSLRSHRFAGGEQWFGQTVPKPNFVFSDRAWNNPPYPSTQYGELATYQYQTSSAGLGTMHGREFDMVNKLVTDIYDLPAYSAESTTYCGHDWKASVELSHRNWHRDGSCYQTILYPDGSTYTPPGTSTEGCNPGWVANGHWVYSWNPFSTNWSGINMRQYDLATTYDVQRKSISGGFYKDVLYWDAPSGIWVPVVEVQSVLRGKCVADGTCTPPVAEPNSISH